VFSFAKIAKEKLSKGIDFGKHFILVKTIYLVWKILDGRKL